MHEHFNSTNYELGVQKFQKLVVKLYMSRMLITIDYYWPNQLVITAQQKYQLVIYYLYIS